MTILQSGLNLCMYQWAHWARTAVQKNNLEGSRTVQNSPESSTDFSRFLEVSGRMLLEGSGRNGFLYIGVDGTLPDWPTIQHCTKGSSSVTSFLSILLGVHSLTAPFRDPVSVAKAFVWLRITPNVAAYCATKSDDRRCLLSLPRREYSRNDAGTVPMFQYSSCARLNILVVHRHGHGTRLGTCPLCTACAVAIVACVIGDGFCCPKSLYARKQDACTIWNNNFVLQTAANNYDRL